MTEITDNELLKRVKVALGIGGTYQDDTIEIYINEVKEYLSSAGVSSTTLQSNKAIGIICRGVADLWNYGAGESTLSSYFMQRASQLVLEEAGNE